MLLHFAGSVRQASVAALGVASALLVVSCGRRTSSTAEAASVAAAQSVVTVGVASVTKRPLQRELTVSSELVPFQEIDVYAKEAGYVKQLFVDYGTHVKQGQLMAVLEIPELEALLHQDEAGVKSMEDQVTNATHQLSRTEAQHKVLHLQYQRLSGVAEKQPGLVAQQEVDEVQGRDLAAEAQVEAAKSSLEAAKSRLAEAEAKLTHDQAIYSYTRITAPFAGVVTQRYANLGTLMQAGTNSSTSVLPLVKLSQESKYRLVIPIPESYVAYIKAGDPVNVRVPSLGKSFPGKVARFSEEVRDATRTMHTEVDVPNPTGELIPGLYANATLTLNRTGDTLAVPVQAIDRESEPPTVLIVDPANRIQRCEVSLGVETENYAEVLSGLSEGQKVVVGDRAGLSPGLAVHPQMVAQAAYQASR